MRIYAYWIKWTLIIMGIVLVNAGSIRWMAALNANDVGGRHRWLLAALGGMLLFPIEWLLTAVAKRRIARKLVHPTFGIFARPPSYQKMLSHTLKSDEEARHIALAWLRTHFYPGVRWYLEQKM